MAHSEEYRMAYEIFVSKYKLNNFDIAAKFQELKGLSAIDDFRMDSSPKKKARDIYAQTLQATLSAHFEAKTAVLPGKEYDLTDISTGDFVEEFDKVIRQIQIDAAPKDKPFSYTKFAGTSSRAMAAQAWKKIERYNAPLSDIWAQQIRKGTCTPDKLNDFTRQPIEILDELTKGNKSKYTKSDEKYLRDVVLAKEAIAAAIKKRSYLSYLNPFNIRKYSREKSCLKMLTAKLEEYRKKGLPTDKVLPRKYTSNMLDKTLNEHTAYVNNLDNAKRYAPEKIEAQLPAQSNDKDVKLEGNFKVKETNYPRIDSPGKIENKDQAMTSFRNRGAFKANLDAVLGDFGTAQQRDAATSAAFSGLHTKLSGAWNGYDLAQTPEAKETEIKECSGKIFSGIYNQVLTEIPGKTTAEKLAMAQKLTNFIMNNYSPAATNTKYEEYGDNYYLRNATVKNIRTDTIAEGNDKELETALTKAQFDLGIVEKYPMDLSNEFANDSSKRSNEIKVNEVPVKNHQLDMV